MRLRRNAAPVALVFALLCALPFLRDSIAATALPRQPAQIPTFMTSDTDAFPPPVRDQDLPDIEARRFPVKPVRMAHSERSYLFEDPSDAQPGVGKIVLLKDANESVMAIRIVRTIPLRKQFIARRVRRYGNHERLAIGQELTALERVGVGSLPPSSGFDVDEEADSQELMQELDTGAAPDFSEGSVEAPAAIPEAPTPAPSAAPETLDDADAASLDELDRLDDQSKAAPLPEPLAEDPELDGAEVAQPSRAHPDDEEEEAVVDPSAELMDDVDPLDIYSHGVTAEFGFIRNNGPTVGSSQFFSTAGIRYGLTLGKMLFARSSRVQDSIGLEIGVFRYGIEGYLSTGGEGPDETAGTDDDDPIDAFTVTPLIGTLRYTLHLSESLGLFAYGGGHYNFARSIGPEAVTNADGVAQLAGFRPAFGGGMTLRMGPGWEARADLGFDIIAFGMMVRF